MIITLMSPRLFWLIFDFPGNPAIPAPAVHGALWTPRAFSQPQGCAAAPPLAPAAPLGERINAVDRGRRVRGSQRTLLKALFPHVGLANTSIRFLCPSPTGPRPRVIARGACCPAIGSRGYLWNLGARFARPSPAAARSPRRTGTGALPGAEEASVGSHAVAAALTTARGRRATCAAAGPGPGRGTEGRERARPWGPAVPCRWPCPC